LLISSYFSFSNKLLNCVRWGSMENVSFQVPIMKGFSRSKWFPLIHIHCCNQNFSILNISLKHCISFSTPFHIYFLIKGRRILKILIFSLITVIIYVDFFLFFTHTFDWKWINFTSLLRNFQYDGNEKKMKKSAEKNWQGESI
jgi:hypothetical protein